MDLTWAPLGAPVWGSRLEGRQWRELLLGRSGEGAKVSCLRRWGDPWKDLPARDRGWGVVCCLVHPTYKPKRSQLLEPLHGGGDRLSNGCQLATLPSGGLQCPPRWVAMLRLVKMLCENAGVMG